MGFMPADLRAWLQDHNKDEDLATALAEVSNHTGLLGYELDEVDDHWLIYAYEEWWELEKELYDLIIFAMKQANLREEANYDLDRIGLYNIVKPFMEKNGFRDGSGWWGYAENEERNSIVLDTIFATPISSQRRKGIACQKYAGNMSEKTIQT